MAIAASGKQGGHNLLCSPRTPLPLSLCTSGATFTSLLARLAAQHERELSEAIHALQEKNRALIDENRRLRGSCPLRREASNVASLPGEANFTASSPVGATLLDTDTPKGGAMEETTTILPLPGAPPTPSDLHASIQSTMASSSEGPSLSASQVSSGSEVGVRILAGHNLQGWIHGLAVPTYTHDLFVVVAVGESKQQTSVIEGSRNPVWNAPEFTFAVHASDEVLELDVVNARTDSSLGKVSLEIRDLLPWQSQTRALPLHSVAGAKGEVGTLEFEVCWRPSKATSQPPCSKTVSFTLEPIPPRRPWAGKLVTWKDSKKDPHHANKATRDADEEKVLNQKHPWLGGALAPSPHAQKLVEKAVSRLEQTSKMKQRERFLNMFELQRSNAQDDDNLYITPDDLVRVLHKRGHENWDLDLAKQVLEDLCIAQGLEVHEDRAMELSRFVDGILAPDLPDHVQLSDPAQVKKLQRSLLTVDVQEVIAKVTRVRVKHYEQEEANDNGRADLQAKILFGINVVVSVTILLSIVSLGMSLDVAPRHWVWILVEVLFGCVFVVELSVKLYILGGREFFMGRSATGNIFDTFITTITLVDVTISMMDHFFADSLPDVSAAKITLALRSLRLARIARLIKIFRGPLVKQLANMLSGFFIGVPSLLWVMVLLAFVIYMLALAARQTIGPADPSQNLIERCGDGDNILTPEDPECTQCKLYTEEFMGSVLTTSFTVFRCIIGDCSSKGGQALTPHFSNCYGWQFDMTYFLGMVAVIFGLFNIITAIFVEATMQGLQFNNAQSKYANMYESNHMRRTLEALVKRIRFLYNNKVIRTPSSYQNANLLTNAFSENATRDCLLTEDEFYRMIQDPEVSHLLEELDVYLDHRLNIFNMFDTSGDGRVSLVEFIETLMKMRGEVQKCDLVASWATVEAMREEIHDFQRAALANQRQLRTREARDLE